MRDSSRKRGCGECSASPSNSNPRVEQSRDLLTVTEAARRLRVSRRTVERMVARGVLPFYELPIRGGLRFSAAEIEAFLESRYNGVVK
ncbi:MAG: helix-turn-helix domain-containing protein [Planctomycetaceae bacterium]|nr:helix-turn-helix domain-containing protein [Planctomycetaceae bacterium]